MTMCVLLCPGAAGRRARRSPWARTGVEKVVVLVVARHPHARRLKAPVPHPPGVFPLESGQARPSSARASASAAPRSCCACRPASSAAARCAAASAAPARPSARTPGRSTAGRPRWRPAAAYRALRPEPLGAAAPHHGVAGDALGPRPSAGPAEHAEHRLATCPPRRPCGTCSSRSGPAAGRAPAAVEQQLGVAEEEALAGQAEALVLHPGRRPLAARSGPRHAAVRAQPEAEHGEPEMGARPGAGHLQAGERGVWPRSSGSSVTRSAESQQGVPLRKAQSWRRPTPTPPSGSGPPLQGGPLEPLAAAGLGLGAEACRKRRVLNLELRLLPSALSLRRPPGRPGSVGRQPRGVEGPRGVRGSLGLREGAERHWTQDPLRHRRRTSAGPPGTPHGYYPPSPAPSPPRRACRQGPSRRCPPGGVLPPPKRRSSSGPRRRPRPRRKRSPPPTSKSSPTRPPSLCSAEPGLQGLQLACCCDSNPPSA